MSEPAKAVFLSYASQDAEVAKRICDALRAAGVEVWFDQSELVGGDAWDQKIRKQIKECALLIPIISAATQARTEGYFRLEWRLADQRTHLMAKGRAFLLPVVIDDTRDAEAHVPDSFTEVQWTRLPGGETPPAFAERVKKLLVGSETVGGALRPDSFEPSGHKAPPTVKSSRPWLIPVTLGAVAIAVATVWFTRQPVPSPAEPSARRSAPTTTETAAAPQTEAQKLVAQARQVLDNGDELNREIYFLAEDLVKRAVALDPADAVAWTFSAEVSYRMVWYGFDSSQARSATMRQHAERACALAPSSIEARRVRADVRAQLRENLEGSVTELLQLAAQAPGDWRVQRALGQTYRFLRRGDESLQALRRARELAQGSPIASGDLVNVLLTMNRFAEAEAVVAEALPRHPTGRLMVFDVLLKTQWRGDLAAATATVAKWPDWLLREDRGAYHAWRAWLWNKQPDRALAVAQRLPHDYQHDYYFAGPRAVLTARAHEQAGHTEAAQADWREVIQLADRELSSVPGDPSALQWKAWALARLGDTKAAQAIGAQLLQQNVTETSLAYTLSSIAPLFATIGMPDAAFAELRRLIEGTGRYGVTRAMLELDPAYEPLRSDPRYPGLRESVPSPSPVSGLPSFSARPEVEPKSVAVLAFANLSDDKANEYFSDGISEELLNVLAKVPQLKVAARTSSFYFKGRNEPIPEIAQKLGVAYVVEGSVRKAGNKVRVTAQLIKASDGFHVWSETYDRDLTDIFAVQDEIAKKILGVVKGSVLGEAELPHATTTNIEAYTLYLQAQGAFAKRGEAGLREAIRLYEAALAIAPDYVPALVGLAQARVVLPNYAYLSGAKARETTDGAIKAARHALELDPQNASAFAVIGWAKFQFDWQWAESETALRRARDLAPNDSWTWNCLGDYYRFVGDLPQALMAKQREWDLDPLSPNSHWDQSYLQLVAGHYDQAIHWAEICMGLAPHNVDSYMPAILAAGRSGRFDLMHRTLAAARQNVHEGEGMMLLLKAYGAILEKKPDEARRLLAAASVLAENENAPPGYLGYCYLLLGDADQASLWLQKGYDRHDPSMVWNEVVDFDVIAANPKTRPLLGQPGLKELYELRQRAVRAGLNKL